MTGRGGHREADAAGGPALHIPVLLAEVVEALGPARGGVFLDGTFGAGGYTRAILEAHPANRVVAIDRDPDAIAGGEALARAFAGRLTLVHGRFEDLDRIAAQAGAAALDGVVLDIGVSSMQLDQAERGFSFRHDAPLDMRMEREGRSAADLLNEAGEAEIADILFRYGEERRSRAIARAIVERRRRQPFAGTADLADLVARYVRAEPGLHPATRSFQALRIAVNDELGQLSRALEAAERALKPGGRLAVVTFHSLEDRIVKQFMQERASRTPRASRHLPSPEPVAPTFTPLTRGPVAAGEEETARNPRARSAKLRAAERTDAAAGPGAPASSRKGSPR
ncbi:16S rRNA (cytosine(1402)-N(4))-methyltransferase RsmH [Enterovirga sp.]|uniref:16S rRNA (cytosine(1402)-N(4))-methyltransferase RsmH n=1 Tax=Enterovirga sp. TaxID=2026350 RepID=UPI002C97E8DA|nr:16S rRNA (cytosine(1402)-N(4))-methyltransferase RsmH [Enterovirga sp.]HMO27784.1 16S rRNA (cytosine(1402)-N(4))-methyltransferase RsmH [Enterovirga sp.]